MNQFLLFLVSILLILGLWQIGNCLQFFKNFRHFNSIVSDYKYSNCYFGVNLLIIILFPLSFIVNVKILLILSVFLILTLGFFRFIKICLYLRKPNKKKINLEKFIIISFIVIGIVSTLQITHVDAYGFNYHIAHNLLQGITYNSDKYFVYGPLISPEHLLMAIGLIVESENFIGLIQFSSLIFLYGLLKKNKSADLLLLVLSMPVIIYFFTSSKTHFLSIMNSIFSFYILVLIYENKSKLNNNNKFYFLVISVLLGLVAYVLKNSSIITNFFSFLLAIYIFREQIKKIFLVYIIGLILLIVPLLSYKYNLYGGNLLLYFFNPIPTHIDGYDVLSNVIKNYKETGFLNIFIFPYEYHFISNTFGFAFLIFVIQVFRNKKFFNNYLDCYVLIYFASFILLCLLFIQPTARFLFEPILLAIIYISQKKIKFLKEFKNILLMNCLMILMFFNFLTYHSILGVFSKKEKHEISKKFVNNFEYFSWISRYSKDKLVIGNSRYNTNKNINFYSIEFLNYLKNKDPEKRQDFFFHLAKLEPSYLEVSSASEDYAESIPDELKPCIIKMVASKENISKFTSRNPLRNKQSRNGFLFSLKNLNETRCFSKKRSFNF